MKTLQEANILIIEDQEINIRLLNAILLREGYTNVIHTTDPRHAVSLFQEFRPDLVLLDLYMPHLDGFGVMSQLRALGLDDSVPILILTSETDPQVRHRALSCGAMDFINKPFQVTEVLLRARNFLTMRRTHLALKEEKKALETMVHQRGQELQEAQLEMLERLAHMAECRHQETIEHTLRVGNIAACLAEKMGMATHEVALMHRAASLHDIGKIAVPDYILLKNGKLTDEEFDIMKTHARTGARLLQGGSSEIVIMAETIALTHHERWDGRGYPRGLQGTEIPLVGRIVGLADVFDALTHSRPYKEAWPIEKAVEEIRSQSGRHFDPEVVEAFLSLDLENEFGLAPISSSLEAWYPQSSFF